MEADTETDMDTHRVLMDSISVLKISFPSLEEAKIKKMDDLVHTFITPDRSLMLSVEQVVACTPKKDSTKTVKLNNDPPIIFVSTRPTILLSLEGTPVKATAVKANLEYVINANYPLFYYIPDSTWFLYSFISGLFLSASFR